ncbi:hypothetical protein Btru_029234 [Bulinus truncatus]|nr:hypothetical protein Btru_029234 [Bulinus truncatus]
MVSMYAMWTLLILAITVNTSVGCSSGAEVRKPVQPECPLSFVLKKIGGFKMCVYFSQETGNYAQAETFCKARGHQLFKPNTLEKFSIIQQEKGLYWVGLSDYNKDGYYDWSDGLGRANPQFLKKIFYQDNGLARQSAYGNDGFFPLNSYCAVYSSNINHLLVDSSCLSVHRFACQE